MEGVPKSGVVSKDPYERQKAKALAGPNIVYINEVSMLKLRPPGENIEDIEDGELRNAACIMRLGGRAGSSASKSSIRRFVITEKAPTRAFSWLKAATTTFTFKTLLN